MRARTRESRKRKRRNQRESRGQQTFRSQLFETLEDRRLLTTVGMTTLEQLQQQEIQDAFERVSNLEEYPSYVLNETRSWVVQVDPGTDINALEQQLNVDTLRPSDLIPNTYIFTLPEAVMPSPPAVSSTDNSSPSADSSGDDTGTEEVPTEELADTTIDPADVIDDGVHTPSDESTSSEESATASSVVIDGVQYGLPVDPVSVLSDRPEVRHFYPLVTKVVDTFSHDWLRPNDQFFPEQWHLYNDGDNSAGGTPAVNGTPGEDISVESVWQAPFHLSGNGVTVGVLDSGIQMDHPDLVRNLEPALACDFTTVAGNTGTILCEQTVDTGMADDLMGHGTMVAGIIGAEANNYDVDLEAGLGVAGIAYNAKLANMKIFGLDSPPLDDVILAEAYSRFSNDVDIYNNSFGLVDEEAILDGRTFLEAPGPLTLAAIQQVIASGRGGLGGILVFSSGNDAEYTDDAPTDGSPDMRTDYRGLQNSRYTINIGGVGHNGERIDYSEYGSSLFAMGYTGDFDLTYGIQTTDLNGNFGLMNGTSAAAPVVSGVLALVLEANPSLTWRDVQHVVVNSVRQTDVLDPSWHTNAAGHQFSEKYGFGVINAMTAVTAAQNWQNVGPEVAISVVADIEDPIPIPDNGTPAAGTGNELGYVVDTVNVGQCLNTESVELVFTAPHDDWTDLSVKLVSPSGTEAVFSEKHDDDNVPFKQFDNWRFSTPMFWDECSAGNWTLFVEDHELHNEGFLEGWTLNVYGTEQVVPPEPPPEESQGDISGIKWHDANEDGVMGATETPVEGVWIYADLDDDGRIDLGEPADITDAHGRYSLSDLPTGDYSIREVLQPGWFQVHPGGSGSHQVTLTAENGPLTGINFGNQYGFDFGDAPAPYPTLVIADGASHGLLEGFHLGANVDAELEGQPDANAFGDDTDISIDDEDGVSFNQMFADTTATLEVQVSNGSNTPGVLQGWIDFNVDGDWNDSGEQIFADQAVTSGLNTLTFNVPASAQPGYTFARFRYGYERGIGPTGAAFAGEVEDHRVLVMENDPIATDDSYVVPQNSVEYTMDVLTDDLPGIVGDLKIVDFSSPNRGGTVEIDTSELFLKYTPAIGFSSPPTETFTYTIEDAAGVTSTATVVVTVTPTFTNPIGIDDSFWIPGSAGAQSFDVITNDIEGIGGPLHLTDVSTPTHGSAVIDPSDDTRIIYTPSTVGAGWFNMVSFTYTAENSAGAEVTANVTMHVEPEESDNSVEFAVEFRDDQGGAIPVGGIEVGDQFQVLVTVEDIRGSLATPVEPGGVFSASMDFLYDRQYVSVVSAEAVTCTGTTLDFGICFDGEYDSIVHGAADRPGLIDEVGAIFGDIFAADPPYGPLVPVTTDPTDPEFNDSFPMEFFVVTFQANAEGDAYFKLDPTDNLPIFETSVYGSSLPVDTTEITYANSLLTIGAASGGAGEGEALDTNGDGVVSPMDALNVINDLNQNGSRAVADGAEGETAAAESRLDVNRDQFISPADALMLINHLNNATAGAMQTSEAPQGEGEAPAPVMGPQPGTQSAADDNQVTDVAGVEADLFAEAVLPSADPARNQQTLSEADASLASQDRIFASLQSDADGEVDGLLDDLAADVCQAWLS